MAAGRPGVRLLVQHHEILAADAERRDGSVAMLQAQPERVLVEADGAVEVRDGEVHRAEPVEDECSISAAPEEVQQQRRALARAADRPPPRAGG